MGTDVVVAYVRETPDFGRAALRKMIVELWRGRGAKVLPARWSRAAADRCWGEDDALLGYAISPTSEGGWIAVLESANASVRMDKELLSLLAARTTCWLKWDCDHSGLYGAQRISKAKSDEPVDLASGHEPYDRLEDAEDWEFLSFSGVGWNAHKDFAIGERTKKHAMPQRVPTADEGAADAFREAVMSLQVDAALAALTRIAKVDADLLDAVFDTSHRAEFSDVATCVMRVGSALAERGSLGAEHWVRLLETAAICNDDAVAKRALGGLAKARGAKPAIAEALARFDAAAAVEKSAYDGRAAMLPAGKRFRRWVEA